MFVVSKLFKNMHNKLDEETNHFEIKYFINFSQIAFYELKLFSHIVYCCMNVRSNTKPTNLISCNKQD